MGWVEFDVDNVVGEIGGWSIDFHWIADQWPEDGTFWVESPDGTEFIIANGISTGDYFIETDEFNGESMQGTWKLWIADSYGDGGLQATDINITITKTYVIYPWLNVDPLAGIAEPGTSHTIQVTCDGSILPLGDYEGTIWVTSNDPDFATIELPVYFTVDYASEIINVNSNEVQVNNFPNPFTTHTTFDIFLPVASVVELEIYNLSGQKVRTLLNDKLSAGLQSVGWKGDNSQGIQVRSGIYFYRLRIGEYEVINKLILMDK
jgi:hypothetical protein